MTEDEYEKMMDKEKLWNRTPVKLFTLRWWLHMHKMALFEMSLVETPAKIKHYVMIANWIAHRIERNFKRK